MTLQSPFKELRTGQYIINLLSYVAKERPHMKIEGASFDIADVFYMGDEEFRKLEEEFVTSLQ